MISSSSEPPPRFAPSHDPQDAETNQTLTSSKRITTYPAIETKDTPPQVSLQSAVEPRYRMKVNMGSFITYQLNSADKVVLIILSDVSFTGQRGSIVAHAPNRLI